MSPNLRLVSLFFSIMLKQKKIKLILGFEFPSKLGIKTTSRMVKKTGMNGVMTPFSSC